MADNLTLMAVHAHPDDEASSTGGVLARYSAEGVRTVLVTCTNGEFGDAPGGIKPGEEGHDEQEVAEIRLAELRESAKILGVTDLELLGYHDSGMVEWDYKSRPDAFCNVPLADVAARIGGLIERYRPQVVVTYDPEGGYEHPDHVHASLGAAEAVRLTGIPAKLYLTAMPVSKWRELWTALREAGADVPGRDDISPETQAADGSLRAAHHDHHRHPPGAGPQAGRADGARQPDQRVLVQQDPARARRAGVRRGELHPGDGLDRGPGA